MYHKLQITMTTYSTMASAITIYITYLHQVLLTYNRKTNKIKQLINSNNTHKLQKNQAGLKKKQNKRQQKNNKKQKRLIAWDGGVGTISELDSIQ